MLIPDYYYKYFVDKFSIPQYTCEPATLTYASIQTPYLCNCNGQNYVSMPRLSIDIQPDHTQIHKSPKEYMMLPFIQYYNNDSSQCLLAIASTENFP